MKVKLRTHYFVSSIFSNLSLQVFMGLKLFFKVVLQMKVFQSFIGLFQIKVKHRWFVLKYSTFQCKVECFEKHTQMFYSKYLFWSIFQGIYACYVLFICPRSFRHNQSVCSGRSLLLCNISPQPYVIKPDS